MSIVKQPVQTSVVARRVVCLAGRDDEARTDDALTGKGQTDEALARKSGCFECHSMGQAGIGPAFVV